MPVVIQATLVNVRNADTYTTYRSMASVCPVTLTPHRDTGAALDSYLSFISPEIKADKNQRGINNVFIRAANLAGDEDSNTFQV